MLRSTQSTPIVKRKISAYVGWGLCVLLSVCTASISWAGNPIVSHVYTADPAARVINGRAYVMVTHDQDNQNDYGGLIDYYLFSSDDMVNWQDHGIVWNSRTDSSWASLAYAPDFIERNGKYYLYFPNGANSIGVAVADSPEGPYTDPLGRPLVDRNTPNANVDWLFDPGVFIDDDGQAFLYFGGGADGTARVIRLNNDMISTSGAAISIDVPNFFEALYMHKRNGIYYLSYSTNPSAGMSIDYMTSNNPTSGFTHRGTILPNPWENNSNNNHQSIIEFNNEWYIFYHNRAVANTRGDSTFSRSINVDRLYYNSDGSIREVNASSIGVPAVRNVNAFSINQAETFDQEGGIETEPSSEGTLNIQMGPGDWIKVANVDFGNGATQFNARVASAIDNSKLEIILGSLSNTPHASLEITNTGGWQNWQTQSTSFNAITGVHDVYLRGTSGHNLNWFEFEGDNSGGSSQLTVELEDLALQSLFAPLSVRSDNMANNGAYIEWSNDGSNQILSVASEQSQGQISVPFTLSQASDVEFSVRVNLANGNDDSFYYKLNSNSWQTFNNQATTGWQVLTPNTFTGLSPGNHILTLLRREDGAKLDTLTLVASAGSIHANNNSSSSTSSSSSTTSSSSTSSSSSSGAAPTGNVTYSINVTNDWQSGYCAELTVTNNTNNALQWQASVSMSDSVDSMWNASWSQSGNILNVSGVEWNNTLQAGQSLSGIGFCATRASSSSSSSTTSSTSGSTSSSSSSGGYTVPSNNFAVNGGVENNLQSWGATAGSVTRSTEQRYSGNASARITNRTENWHGLTFSVGELTQGNLYEVAVWVKLVAGSADTPITLTAKRQNDSDDSTYNEYTGIVTTIANDSEWVLLHGQYTQTGTAFEHFIIESESDSVSFYADEFSIGGEVTPKNEVGFFVGNITTNGNVRNDFTQYWDQLTPENEGKWGSVERTRDVYDWSGLDRAYNYAKQNNIPFKQHTMVWGSQQPNWIDSLSPAEQAAEIEEWIRDYCARYPDTEMIDVVNEATPGHAPANYAASAFGNNWIIRSFELTRQYCPNSILILNDYNVLSWNTQEFIQMATPAVNAGVVDAIGLQAHGLADWSLSDLETKLNQVAALGLPIYISEYDIEKTNDQEQLRVMQTQFPLFYNHPSVKGITIWGYVVGATWRDGTGLLHSNGTPRPALTWLMDYLNR